MAVLAAMGEREASRIAETVGRAVHHLRDHCQATARCGRRHPAQAAARRNRRVRDQRPRRACRAAGAASHRRPHLVMGGHDEMRQQRLRRPSTSPEPPRALPPSCDRARERVRPERRQQSELAVPRAAARRSVRLTIIALPLWPSIAACGVFDEALQPLRQPVIAPRLAVLAFMPC